MVDTSESATDSLTAIQMETASTMVAGTTRRTGIAAYVAGFVQGAEDSGGEGVFGMKDKDAIGCFTFPIKPRDLISPVASSCPDLKVLEA